MTERRFVPIDYRDNTSADPLNPDGTRITAERLEHMQTQYLAVAGVQVLDELPPFPEEGVNLAVLSTDGRLYLHIGGAWRRIALED